MENENQQANERKSITLFRIEKKQSKSPDYNGSIEWPLQDGCTEEEKAKAKIGDVLMWRGMIGEKKRFTGMFIYTEEVAELIGKATERFTYLVTHEADEPKENGPNISGFLRTDSGDSFRCSLWKKQHDRVKGGFYYSGSLQPEVNMENVGGF